MLYAKFQDHRTSCSVVEDFLRFFPYMGMTILTWTIYMNFLSPFPWRFHMKSGFDMPKSKKVLKMVVICMYIAS